MTRCIRPADAPFFYTGVKKAGLAKVRIGAYSLALSQGGTKEDGTHRSNSRADSCRDI